MPLRGPDRRGQGKSGETEGKHSRLPVSQLRHVRNIKIETWVVNVEEEEGRRLARRWFVPTWEEVLIVHGKVLSSDPRGVSKVRLICFFGCNDKASLSLIWLSHWNSYLHWHHETPLLINSRHLVLSWTFHGIIHVLKVNWFWSQFILFVYCWFILSKTAISSFLLWILCINKQRFRWSVAMDWHNGGPICWATTPPWGNRFLDVPGDSKKDRGRNVSVNQSRYNAPLNSSRLNIYLSHWYTLEAYRGTCIAHNAT